MPIVIIIIIIVSAMLVILMTTGWILINVAKGDYTMDCTIDHTLVTGSCVVFYNLMAFNLDSSIPLKGLLMHLHTDFSTYSPKWFAWYINGFIFTKSDHMTSTVFMLIPSKPTKALLIYSQTDFQLILWSSMPCKCNRNSIFLMQIIGHNSAKVHQICTKFAFRIPLSMPNFSLIGLDYKFVDFCKVCKK